MEGTNTLKINHATMVEIVNAYFYDKFPDDTIVSVCQTGDSVGCFSIILRSDSEEEV